MLIDWFTVVAQAINFVILVWLLKRLLYQPILDAIDAREQRIAAELADAEAAKQNARKEREEFRRKNEEFSRQRDAMLSDVEHELKETRQRLLEEAHQAADALSARRQEELQREQQKLSSEIGRHAQQEVFAIARKTLHDLADTSLEQCIIHVFLSRLRELNGQAKQELSEALSRSPDPARVRSSFELPVEQQSAIQQALKRTFSAEIPVQFETAPGIISGIELTASGRQVSWNIADYLKSLESSIIEPRKT
jgi:F-type H+-transporting ATPase subunit b